MDAFGQLVFGYSTANEDLKIDYVRVRTPDGQLVETPLSSTQDFAPEVLRQAPMYSDYRQRHVSVVGLRMRTIALPLLVSQTASARFTLLFDNSNSPDRIQFLDGDDALRNAAEKPQRLEYPVRFPDVSSIKIIRLGRISCGVQLANSKSSP